MATWQATAIGAVFTVIGAVIGTYAGGQTALGAQAGLALGMAIGGAIGGLAGNALFPDKIDIDHPPPPQPRENSVQTSTYGASIPIVYKHARLAGNIIAMQDVQETIERSRHRQEGVRYYEMVKTYTSTFAVAFCEGPVDGISRIWINNKLWAEMRDPSSPYYPIGSTGLVFVNMDTTLARGEVYFQTYLGSESQTPDPTLESIYGAGNVPAYRGITYIVFKNFPVGEFSGLPTVEVEIGPVIEEVDFTGWSVNNATATADEVLFNLTYAGSMVSGYATPGLLAEYNSFELVWEWDIQEVTGSFYPDVTGNYCYVQLINNAAAPVNGINARIGTNGAGNYVFSLWMYAGAVYVNDVGMNHTSLPLRRTLRLSRVGTTCTLYIYNGATLEETLTVSHADFTHTDLKQFQFGLVIQSGSGTHMKYYLRDVQWSDQAVSGIDDMLLSDVVSDICDRAGLASAEIDVTGLADSVIGYTIPRQIPARTALETLMAAYGFDAAEEDWKVVFKKRGASSSATITQEDLRAHAAGSSPPDLAVETRTQDIELPTHFTLSYESIARDYGVASQHAVRIDKAAQVMKSASLGIVLTDGQAKQRAEILLKQIWIGRHSYAFSTNYDYIGIAPADVVTVMGKQMRVVQIMDRGGVLDFFCESEEGGVYTSAAEADDLYIYVPDMTEDAYIPSFIALNLPPLDDDHGSAGLYFAVYGLASSFRGGTIQRSTDGGASYTDVGFVATGASAVVGDCTTTLANGIDGCLDYTAGVTVDLADSEGTLSSASDAELAEGANLAAIGSPGGNWEIIQFKTATLVSGNTYTLTGLLRGLRGTARYMATHAAGERFVRLNDLAGIDFVGANTAAIGVSYLYRVKNPSGTVGTPAAYATGDLALKPFPAAAVQGGRNASGDLVLSWQRSDRYEFLEDDFPDGSDIDMNEVSESYEVDVIHSGTGAVLRTLTASTPTITYTAAQQSADSYPSGAVTFDIYQVSTVVGRGIAKRVSV